MGNKNVEASRANVTSRFRIDFRVTRYWSAASITCRCDATLEAITKYGYIAEAGVIHSRTDIIIVSFTLLIKVDLNLGKKPGGGG